MLREATRHCCVYYFADIAGKSNKPDETIAQSQSIEERHVLYGPFYDKSMFGVSARHIGHDACSSDWRDQVMALRIHG